MITLYSKNFLKLNNIIMCSQHRVLTVVVPRGA